VSLIERGCAGVFLVPGQSYEEAEARVLVNIREDGAGEEGAGLFDGHVARALIVGTVQSE